MHYYLETNINKYLLQVVWWTTVLYRFIPLNLENLRFGELQQPPNLRLQSTVQQASLNSILPSYNCALSPSANSGYLIFRAKRGLPGSCNDTFLQWKVFLISERQAKNDEIAFQVSSSDIVINSPVAGSFRSMSQNKERILMTCNTDWSWITSLLRLPLASSINRKIM